jgi:type IV pilus assembly protein PilC
MSTFHYEAKDAAGQVISGIVQAATLSDAGQQLRAAGKFILSLSPDGDASKKNARQPLCLPPGLKDVQSFTSQLAVMVKAGIPLRAAVEGIADQTEHPKFKLVLQQIKKDVESGKQFSDALARYPKVFSPLYVNMVRASEMSGGLAKMLDKLAGYLGQQIETAAMVRGAMIYPGIIGTLAVTTTVFLLTFVLPRIMPLFAGKEALLPAPTKLLLSLSAFMTAYWYVLLAAALLGAWGLYLVLKTAWGARALDQTKLKFPVFKKLFRALYISRSLHTMGQLLNAGVPMLDTIHITAEISGNAFYRDLWKRVGTSVKQGKKLSAPLHGSPLLPKSVVQMIGAGEESGKLGEVLDEVSEFYARELKAVIKTCTAMIEPLMIVVMGAVVGFIAMSIILPIFKMSSMVQ